jgi:hypothetical protein
MKKTVTYTLLVAAALQATLPSAQAGAYNFGGNCPSQGAWTQMALQQTQQIAAAVRQLKDNPACKGINSVVANLQAASALLATPDSMIASENRLESLPGQMGALRTGVMEGGALNTNTASMLLNRTIEAAAVSSELNQATSGYSTRQTDIAKMGNGISNLFSKVAAPTQKGLDLVTQVMQVLPEYDECLIGQPQQAMAIMGGAIKVAAAFSAAGEGVGDKLGSAIATLATMMRDRRFTSVLRKLNETEFWFSISCLLESTAKNYCDAQNAQEILNYSKTQYTSAMKRSVDDRKDASYDNPLEGYYLLVRELPIISAWLQKVQFGVTPKLSSDANFKNKIWDQVTDMTKSVNSLTGYFNEQMLFMKELSDPEAKKNHLINVLGALVAKMSGGDGDGGTSAQFFTTSVNPTLLPFKLIGRETVPVECRVTENRPIAQPWDQWMKTGSPDGSFIADFNDPDKLALVIQNRMDAIVASASQKQSAYFRQRLVMDMPNLVNQTLTGQYMTVRKSFENVFNYLVRFENRLNKTNMDLVMVPSVRETKVKIQKFLKSYDALRALGEKVAKTSTVEGNEALLKDTNMAAQAVLDTVFNEFNVLFQKDTFLTNRVTTFIEKDFSMRIREGLNMSPYQQDLLIITQKNLLDKLTEVHGLNPTSAQIDLARAQVINKQNLNAIEQIFSDSMYRMILEMKAIASGKGSAEIRKQLDKRFNAQRTIARKTSWYMPTPFGGGLIAWLTSGFQVRSDHPDLYDGRDPNKGVTSKIDDTGKSFGQMQAMFCAQTLAFENRGIYADLCAGTKMNTFYQNAGDKLDFRYDDFINKATPSSKINKSAVLTGKNICAFNNFAIKNLVQWLRDQDSEMYEDMNMQ